MSGNGKVAKNLLYVFASEGVGGVLSFLILLLCARLLGVEAFGVFSFILAITSVCQLVADFGLTNLIVREVAKDKTRTAYIMGNVLTLAWCLSAIMFVVIALCGWGLLDSVTQWVACLIMAAAVLATYHSVVYSSVCRAFEEMGYNAFCFVAHKIVLLALAWWWGGESSPFSSALPGICSAYLVANLLQYLFFFIVVSSRFVTIRFGRDWHYALSLFRAAVPVGASMVVRRLTLQVDVLILSVMLGATAVGVFSAAYKVVQMVDMIPFALCLPLFPALSRLAAAGSDELLPFFQRCVKGFVLLALPLTGYLFVSADSLITLFYADEFAEAGGLLRILAFTVVGLFINMLLSYLFVALNHQRFYLLAALGCLLVNAVADLIFIPLLGVQGAAWGTLLGELCYFMLALGFLKRCEITINWVALFWRPALLSILCCLPALLWLPHTFWELVAFTTVFFTLYISGLLLLRIFQVRDVTTLASRLVRRTPTQTPTRESKA